MTRQIPEDAYGVDYTGPYYDGCDYHAHCLTCPLPRCRYDDPGGIRGILNETRDSEVRRLRSEGWTVAAIAREVGVARRLVYSICGPVGSG